MQLLATKTNGYLQFALFPHSDLLKYERDQCESFNKQTNELFAKQNVIYVVQLKLAPIERSHRVARGHKNWKKPLRSL